MVFFSCPKLIGTCILDSFDLQTNTNMVKMVTCTITTTTTPSPQTPRSPRPWPQNSPTAKSRSTKNSPVLTWLVPIRTVLTSCVASKDWMLQTSISIMYLNLSPSTTRCLIAWLPGSPTAKSLSIKSSPVLTWRVLIRTALMSCVAPKWRKSRVTTPTPICIPPDMLWIQLLPTVRTCFNYMFIFAFIWIIKLYRHFTKCISK